MIVIHPTGHRVLVRLVQIEEEVTKGGIIIATEGTPQQKRVAQQEAIVVEIGENAWKAFDDGHPWAKCGDRVLIAKYSGEDRIDEETKEIYRVINDEDIFATLEAVGV